MGGGVAWRYTVAHPKRVRALILIDACGQPDPPDSYLPNIVRFVSFVAEIPPLRLLASNITPRLLIELLLHGTVGDQETVTPALIDRCWDLARSPGSREAAVVRISNASALSAANAWEEAQMRRISAPSLILWGSEDRVISPKSAAWFAARLRSSRVVSLNGVGHTPMEEAPLQSLRPVLSFLKTVKSSRR
jgi:pimeloyl-ACP methyl ester carboxylesterase